MNESMKYLVVMIMAILTIAILKPLGAFIFMAGMVAGLLLENK